MQKTPQLISVAQAARSLGISDRKIQQLIACGSLVSLKIGRRRLIDVVDLQTFIEKLKRMRDAN